MVKFKSSEITPEKIYKNRRNFIKNLGLATGSLYLSTTSYGLSSSTDENELRNQGVFTDDIGRIVADPTENYNTIENVMAGYNANMITQDTIDKRIDRISKTLKEKYEIY